MSWTVGALLGRYIALAARTAHLIENYSQTQILCLTVIFCQVRRLIFLLLSVCDSVTQGKEDELDAKVSNTDCLEQRKSYFHCTSHRKAKWYVSCSRQMIYVLVQYHNTKVSEQAKRCKLPVTALGRGLQNLVWGNHTPHEGEGGTRWHSVAQGGTCHVETRPIL